MQTNYYQCLWRWHAWNGYFGGMPGGAGPGPDMGGAQGGPDHKF